MNYVNLKTNEKLVRLEFILDELQKQNQGRQEEMRIN